MVTKPRVAITTCRFNLYGDAIKNLARSCEIIYVNHDEIYSEKDLMIRLCDNIEGVIAGADEPFTEQVFKHAPKLRVISRLGVGIDNIDTASAARRNISIYITQDETTDAVAEHTLALTLAVTKRLCYAGENNYDEEGHHIPGIRIHGKTVGIIGLGRIGLRVAELFDAFGCEIIFYDPKKPGVRRDAYAKFTDKKTHYKADSIEELVSVSDIVTLHAPGQKEPLLGKKELEHCKKGVIIINTARESLIDEDALAAEIKSGRVAGVGADVVRARSPLSYYIFSKVVMTPHVASYTYESRDEMENKAVENLITGLERDNAR